MNQVVSKLKKENAKIKAHNKAENKATKQKAKQQMFTKTLGNSIKMLKK